VHYSPFLDQFGKGDSANVHGRNVWTGGLANPINPLGNSIDPNGQTRGSWGSSNANNGGRTWNRFQSESTANLSVYALSAVLTVGPGVPDVPFAISIITAVAPETGFDLTWPSKEGRAYRLRSSATLETVSSTWEVVAEDIPSAGDTTTVNVTPAEVKLFYVVEEYLAP